MTNKKNGWIPGQVSSFTPSRYATWTDEFNELLKDYRSRNELTSLLIEEGLKRYREKNVVHVEVEVDDLTPEQRELIESPAAKEIVKNLTLALLGNDSRKFTKTITERVKTETEVAASNEQIEHQDEKADLNELETKAMDAFELLRLTSQKTNVNIKG